MTPDKMILEKKIIFFTYLTNYNINDINKALSFNRTDDFIEFYLKARRDNKDAIPEKFVEEARNNSRERFEELRYFGISLISRFNTDYPDSLKDIYQSPPMLYVRGKLKKRTNIAVIGTRETSNFAAGTVEKFVSGLTPQNGVVSGLALGIDTLAHKAALDKDIYTIAVLPNSLDHIYPKENYELANRILDNDGALISELSIGINRGKKSFVERNRLQSGLSEYVFPVELGIKSGTMHTVDFCIRQGKYLLIAEVDKDRAKLPQYEGVAYLRNKKYDKTLFLNQELDLPGINQNETPKEGPSLFNQS
jgi:DNA protecting protein DprA